MQVLQWAATDLSSLLSCCDGDFTRLMLTLSGKVPESQSLMSSHAAFFITWGFIASKRKYSSVPLEVFCGTGRYRFGTAVPLTTAVNVVLVIGHNGSPIRRSRSP